MARNTGRRRGVILLKGNRHGIQRKPVQLHAYIQVSFDVFGWQQRPEVLNTAVHKEFILLKYLGGTLLWHCDNSPATLEPWSSKM